MRIGFAGAHRTGKSTLAEAVAKSLNLEFKATSVSTAPVWRNCHMTPSDQVTFAERVFLQQQLMQYVTGQLDDRLTSVAFDRTPVDLVGYLLANVDSTCGNLQHEAVNKLTLDSVKNTTQHFDHVFIVQPGIDVVEDVGKVGKTFLSKPYQMAVSNHIIATCVNFLPEHKFTIMPTHLRSLADRVQFVRAKLGK